MGRVNWTSLHNGLLKGPFFPPVSPSPLPPPPLDRQHLYLATRLVSGGGVRVLGMLKTGVKTLFIRSFSGTQREISPVCVLDFYVHESVQRAGIGKSLFEHFLSHERVKPPQLGYDRPSPKLIAFLRKHYALTEYLLQANNFVVFNAYFDALPSRIHEPNARPVLVRVSWSPSGPVWVLLGDSGVSGWLGWLGCLWEEESAVVGPHALMKHASVHPRRASYRDTKLSLAN